MNHWREGGRREREREREREGGRKGGRGEKMRARETIKLAHIVTKT